LLTAFGVAIAIIAFLFLHTLLAAWHAGVEGAASDRMYVRNKISIAFALPVAYVEKVKGMVGDRGAVSYANWFGAIYPKDEHGFFGNFASEDGYLKLFPEIVINPEQWEAYMQDRSGAVVGTQLAQKYGWKIGDKITLAGTIYPGNWDFNVRAIYTSTSRAVDEATMFFHWKYMNESPQLAERLKDRVSFVAVKVDPAFGTQLAQSIDKSFTNSPAETRSESEKQFQLEFLSMAGTFIVAFRLVSLVVLLILALVLANTLAMSTRERITEFGVMRAIGFQSRHITGIVLGEGILIALVGSLLGVALATPILKFVARTLQKQMGGFLGNFDLDLNAVALAIAVALVLGVVAAELPAYRAGKRKIVDALRRVE
jgi:putative ABC transport system permease protein